MFKTKYCSLAYEKEKKNAPISEPFGNQHKTHQTIHEWMAVKK